MYDLHTHTILSDGELLPVELLRRFSVLGYKTVGITDHVDASNISFVLGCLGEIRGSASKFGIGMLTGVEITHVPPDEIASLAARAKNSGADIVIVHGETVVEPVAEGTNTAACSCIDVDVLAHPGLISYYDAVLAKENGIVLEVTSRNGHNRTNGHVVQVAREAGCRLAINSDTHSPSDIMTKEMRYFVARGAGLTDEESRKALSEFVGGVNK
jgi:histidinol phosphatase-like PHP family hydrolase